MVSFLESYIIAMTTQAFVTGLYFASVLLCLQWLVFSNTGRVLRKGINWSLVITTIVLFSLFVTDLGYALRDMFLIFEGDGDRSDKYFATSVTVRNSTICSSSSLNSPGFYTILLSNYN